MTTPRLLVLLVLLLGLTAPASPAVADAPAGARATPGPVTGRVVGAGSQPLSGLVVQLLDLEGAAGSPKVRTTADGRFRFPGDVRPSSFLVVVCEGGGSPCRRAADTSRVVRRFVGPGGASYSPLVLGRSFVTTGDGGPLTLGTVRTTRPGQVEVHLRNGAVLGEDTRQLLEVSGIRAPLKEPDVVVGGLAPGVHRVRVLGQERVVRVRSGRRTEVTFDDALPRASGRVVRFGRPVSDVWVQVSDGDTVRTVQTGPDGRWSVGGLTAGSRWTIRVGMEHEVALRPHERPHGLPATARRGPPAAEPPTFAVGVPHGYRRVLLDTGDTVRVDAVSVRGEVGGLRVTAPEGQGHEVALLDPAGRWVAALPSASDSMGRRYVLDQLRPERYTVIGTWRSGLRRSDSTPVRVTGGGTAIVALESRAGPGSLTVKALPGQLVAITADSPERTGESFDRWGTHGEQDVGPRGSVVFAERDPGDYRVVVSAGSSTSHTPLPEPQVVSVAQDAVVLDTRAATRRGTVRVGLVDATSGERLPWTRALAGRLTCADADFAATVVPVPGPGPVTFVLRTLPAGTYECHVKVHDAAGAPYDTMAGVVRASLATDAPLRVVAGQDGSVDLPVTYRRTLL